MCKLNKTPIFLNFTNSQKTVFRKHYKHVLFSPTIFLLLYNTYSIIYMLSHIFYVLYAAFIIKNVMNIFQSHPNLLKYFNSNLIVHHY
jgi:hypothetical protein